LKAEAAKGKKIYTNIHLNFPGWEALDIDDVINCRLRDCIVYIDEAHQLLGRRRSMSSANIIIVDNFISMASKAGVELWLSSQFPRKVDQRVSELELDYGVLCTKYVWENGGWRETTKDAADLGNTPCLIVATMQQMFDNKIIQLPPIYANDYYSIYDRYEIVKIKNLDMSVAKYKARADLIKQQAREAVKHEDMSTNEYEK
jgi:hypothetical protein